MRMCSVHLIALATVATAATLTACGTQPPAADPSGDASRIYPGELKRPSALGANFAVKQHLRVRFRGREDGFDAVLQKQGDELLVVGLGPVGVRAFVLKQAGDAISFEQRFGPKFPFPPRNVLVDIHRAYFMQLSSPPPSANAVSSIRGDQDGEQISETWQGGNLIRKSFQRPGQTGEVTLSYEGPCTRSACRPSRIALNNGWYGYELIIENEDYMTLEQTP
jgi:hypothetical protein